MPTETELKVHILSITPDAERVCAAAARQCYSPENASEAIHKLTEQQIKKTLFHCITSRHLAVLSAASATVAVNVSRECLTQLNTHAFVKTVTQSQQYVAHRDFRYHLIDPYREDEEQLKRFVADMEYIQESYNWHRNRFIQRGYTAEKANEYARMVLGNACEANLVMSGNLWGWYQWINRRVCKRNTFITLQLAQKILILFRQMWPIIFKQCGADCALHGCRETRPCGEPYGKAGD